MLEVKNLRKEYGDLVAVDDIDLRIEDGEFATIVGPSGCGKTTTLKTIAGHLRPTSGSVEYRGEDITFQKPGKRPTCMVFQDWALFPHLTVRENVKFPMENKENGDTPKTADMDTRADDLLKQVQLDPSIHGDKTPDGLSGGQKQRVAIARSLAYDPDILLLDEPLESLDYVLKIRLQRELNELQSELGSTFIYVTHSLESALILSDKLFVMNQGELVQVGSPQEIYNKPTNRFVAEFMGDANIFPVTVEAQDGDTIELSSPEFDRNYTLDRRATDDLGYLVVRHDNSTFSPELTEELGVRSEVYNINERGNVALVQVRSIPTGEEYVAEMRVEKVAAADISVGTEGHLQWDNQQTVMIPE
jgi:ABC-type Fe3+/spermidine/putrescine transport system ATPase subunit